MSLEISHFKTKYLRLIIISKHLLNLYKFVKLKNVTKQTKPIHYTGLNYYFLQFKMENNTVEMNNCLFFSTNN